MKSKIITQVIAREGGFSDRKNDSGGKTRYGITEKRARKSGYKGDMHALPYATAVQIYEDEFWPASFDALAELSPSITAECFDTGVNLGPLPAGKFLQRSLNVLNRMETDYDDIKVDGIIGSGTIKALKAFLSLRRARGEQAILTAINSLQGASYITLAEKRKKDESNLFGWLCHRITL